MLQRRGVRSIFLLVAVVLAAAASATHQHTSRQQANTTLLDDYEYVIIGSGPGGGPLAARLAIAGYKTLLIEAGDDRGDDLKERVPAFHGQSSEHEPMRWDFWVRHYDDDVRQARDSKCTYETADGGLYTGLEPPAGARMKGILYPRAGTLGGCGSHNALVTIYPHEQDWEHLVQLTGDDSWSAANMRKYFQRLERAEYLLGNNLIGHGVDGWLTTGTTDLTLVLEDVKLLQMVAAAARALGRNVVESLLTTLTGLASLLLLDLNLPGKARDQSTGLYQVPLAIKDYARNGPREFVLDVASSGKYPLDIRMNCLATKIRFENDTTTGQPRAVGVDFLDGQALYRADPRASPDQQPAHAVPGRVNATREVVVAGGVFNTPQLLKLSGIGPADELAAHAIPLIKDLPGVGTNLQDRYEVPFTVAFDGNFSVTEDCTYGAPGDPCLQRWLDNAAFKGVYGSSGLALSAILKSSTAAAADPADLIVLGVPANFKGYFCGYSDYAVADSRHWSWLTLKAHTRNRAGGVRLRSADPLDTPLISFRYFDEGDTANQENEQDLQAVFEGVEFGRKILAGLSPTAGEWVDVRPPERSEEATKQFIQDEAWGHHASCTAPIGSDDDPMAVLDGDFRVRGVGGLRVVDASAMPRIHGFFIATSVYMFSEKAADVIIAEAKGGSSANV